MASAAYAAISNVVTEYSRPRVRAFLSGPRAQTGVMLSGVLLLLGKGGLTQAQALAMGILVAVLCTGVVWRMRKTYGDSLLTALREGISDVFSPLQGEGKTMLEDSQARAVAAEGLKDPRSSIRRKAVPILVRLGAREDVESIGEICDAGPGIPPEARERIFESFFTTKPPGVGTGLGFHTSHNIVALHHRGQFTVESRPGSTCFHVRLPMRREQRQG